MDVPYCHLLLMVAFGLISFYDVEGNPVSSTVPGGWSAWGDWSASCLADQCNETGVQLRERYCNNPAPRDGGSNCIGSCYGKRSCTNTEACPVDGRWSEWGPYGECSETCGPSSFRKKTRSCNDPAPRNGGSTCVGRGVDALLCDNLPACPTESPPDYSFDSAPSNDDDNDNVPGIEDMDGTPSGSGANPTPEANPLDYSFNSAPDSVPNNEQTPAPNPIDEDSFSYY